MLGELFNNPISFVFWLVALMMAITIHEFSHAFAAERLGDPTPRLQGRLTLNPLAHLDPLGTLMLLLIRFGWGKPVQFDPFNLRHPRRDAAVISLAGPASNLVVALACSIALHILFNFRLPLLSNSVIGVLVYLAIGMLQPIVVLNVMLAIFNLIPVHPLDGFKIVGGILPEEYARQWYQLEPYGLLFLLFLIFPLFGRVAPIIALISPIINFILSILLPNAPLI
ncbi:site-2 protease family protein [Candidatus Gottesmanbacteria bacterium]|nr:site-2 protease family protein [Candidatus Gottesmanbacteria bacterium]